jgi:hypothetical protein
MGAYIDFLKSRWNDGKIQAEELKKKTTFKKKKVEKDEENKEQTP